MTVSVVLVAVVLLIISAATAAMADRVWPSTTNWTLWAIAVILILTHW